MKKLFQLITIIISGLLLNACYYEAYPEDDPDGTEPPIENVSYAIDIVPLWGQCVGCHNGAEPPDLRDDVTNSSYTSLLNGYVEPNNADASILYKSLINADNVPLMPPGSPWPKSKIDLVKAWINQGALNN